MESRHENCKENSSKNRPSRNATKQIYSLPVLQKENEKMRNDLIALKAAYDEKDILLTETFRKVELLEEENHEMRNLLHAAANRKKVATKDAAVSVTIETNNASQSTSDTPIRIRMRDASTCIKVATMNKSTSTSIIMKDASTFVRIATKNIATQVEVETSSVSMPSSSDSEIECEGESGATSLLFNEPYDEKSEVEKFEKNLKNPKVSSNLTQHLRNIGGATISKKVNNIINSIVTKRVLKMFVWDAASPNSFQNLKNILNCIYSVVCSEENTQQTANNIIKNAIKNARAKE